MKKSWKCRYCGRTFDRKTVKGGYIDQCDKCTLTWGDRTVDGEDIERYIGTHGECKKSANIIIHKKNLTNVKRYLRGDKSISMGFDSIATAQEKQAKKDEKDIEETFKK